MGNVLANKTSVVLLVFTFGLSYASDSVKSKSTRGLSRFDRSKPQLNCDTNVINVSNNSQKNNKKLVIGRSKSTRVLRSFKKTVNSSTNEIILRGRKRKRSDTNNIHFENNNVNVINKKSHNKYSKDNCIAKIKSYTFNSALCFINKVIRDKYWFGIQDKKIGLKKIDYKLLVDGIKDSEFISKPIKEILSQKISPIYEDFEENYNTVLIRMIIENEMSIKEENERTLTRLFNLMFIYYAKHFSGVEQNSLLNGMETISDYKERMASGDDDYFKRLVKIAQDFENKIKKKNDKRSGALRRYYRSLNRVGKLLADKYLREIRNKKNNSLQMNTDREVAQDCDRKLRGRKNKTHSNTKTHSRNSDDNCIQKIKTNALGAVLEFINLKIIRAYMGRNNKIKGFKMIVPNIYNNNSGDCNLINTSIEEIFSSDISLKYKNFGVDYNRKLIKRLKRDGRKEVLRYLDKKFIVYIKHFSGVEQNSLLNGMKTIYDYKERMTRGDDDYFKRLVKIAQDFENKIVTIKRRISGELKKCKSSSNAVSGSTVNGVKNNIII